MKRKRFIYGISNLQSREVISEEEYNSYRIESVNLEWNKISSPSLSLSSKPDLREYLETDIMAFVNIVDGMYDVGATDGSIEYSNGNIIVSAGYDSNNIMFASIDGKCEYSIYGIEYGMSFEMATDIAYQSCQYITDDLPYYKRFVMTDGTSLSFHAEDEKTVDGISIFLN